MPLKTINNAFLPIDLGTSIAINQCQSLNINALSDHLKKLSGNLFVTVERIVVRIIPTIPYFGGERFWFSCPLCNHSCGIIYSHPIVNIVGCRKCLNLTYPQQRYKGMVEQNLFS